MGNMVHSRDKDNVDSQLHELDRESPSDVSTIKTDLYSRVPSFIRQMYDSLRSMGSLMAGWQTNRSAPQKIVERSNSSVTNNEVQRFWRSRRSSLRSHIRYVESRQEVADTETSANRSDSESSSSPTTGSPTSSSPLTAGYSAERPGWWTRSSSAHLNEPPLVGSKQDRYTAQFDVFEICGNSSLVQRRNSASAMITH